LKRAFAIAPVLATCTLRLLHAVHSLLAPGGRYNCTQNLERKWITQKKSANFLKALTPPPPQEDLPAKHFPRSGSARKFKVSIEETFAIMDHVVGILI